MVVLRVLLRLRWACFLIVCGLVSSRSLVCRWCRCLLAPLVLLDSVIMLDFSLVADKSNMMIRFTPLRNPMLVIILARFFLQPLSVVLSTPETM